MLSRSATLNNRQRKRRRPPTNARISARLATIEPASRSRINYARLDARLKRMVEKPTMVGMAVGIVENGRITFLNGYGETLEGSGEKVTPETVFRWASVSKGVASTMVAKLAEDGRLRFDQPVAAVAPSLHLPGRNELKATVGDVLSHGLAFIATPSITSWRRARTSPSCAERLRP